MTPLVDHVYACTWFVGALTYVNLVTSAAEDYVSVIFLSATRHTPFKTRASSWSKPDAVIVHLGHRDELPELFI